MATVVVPRDLKTIEAITAALDEDLRPAFAAALAEASADTTRYRRHRINDVVAYWRGEAVICANGMRAELDAREAEVLAQIEAGGEPEGTVPGPRPPWLLRVLGKGW